jgi:hypothetical protein
MLDPVRLHDVADFDVVIARDLEAAFEAFANFADILLEALKRI